jgi:L-ascorbate metabolism protein UlaG (beta-lactamase superfamily)
MAVKKVSVTAVHAYNVKRFRTPGNPFHPKGAGVGYIITIGNHVIYHAGDTDLIPEMKELGRVDVALLPVGDTYTMDIPEAVEAAKTIKPSIAIPMHTWDKNVDGFKKSLEKTPETKAVILREGEEFVLD